MLAPPLGNAPSFHWREALALTKPRLSSMVFITAAGGAAVVPQRNAPWLGLTASCVALIPWRSAAPRADASPSAWAPQVLAGTIYYLTAAFLVLGAFAASSFKE